MMRGRPDLDSQVGLTALLLARLLPSPPASLIGVLLVSYFTQDRTGS